MRIVRFARAVGKIERGADVGHRSFPERRASRRGLAAESTQDGGQNGVNRPLPLGVNVFFAFGLNGTYQSGRLPGLPVLAMPKPPRHKDQSLADLRREIDRIDEAMHELLIERGEIIDRLIAVKKTEETGSAFRPAREADMMRRLVQAPSRQPAARYRREHLARHHLDLHLCAGAVLRCMPTCPPATR